MVWTIQAMVFLVQIIVGLTQTLFSEMEPIFYASETSFSIMQKTIGKVPAAIMHPNRIFRRA
jgi:hypothetical protein